MNALRSCLAIALLLPAACGGGQEAGHRAVLLPSLLGFGSAMAAISTGVSNSGAGAKSLST